VSEFYSPGYERSIRWNDPAFRIQWPIEPLIISPKDASHPDFV
jgi:dTDP-4-dehydrorhamnose 3,5-epimerase